MVCHREQCPAMERRHWFDLLLLGGNETRLTSHENADGIETEILHNTDTVLSHIFVHLAVLNIATVLWRLVRLPHLLVDKS